MKSLKTSLLFLIMLTFSFFISAQSKEYIKGYLVNLEGDTIVGYIKDAERTKIGNELRFKPTKSSAVQKYSPETIAGFYFEPSFYFESVTVDNNGQKKQQFLRKWSGGEVALYQFFDLERSQYLLVKSNSERLQITKRDSTAGNQYFEDSKYIGQIKYFLRDYPAIATIKSIGFNGKSIAKVVQKYNQYKNPNQIASNLGQGRKLKIKFGLTVGLQSNKMTISEKQLPKRAYENSNRNFQFGGLIDFSYFRKFSLQTGILYNAYSSENSYTYSLGTGVVTHEITNLELPIVLKYNFSQKKLAPYLYAGYKLGFFLDGTSSEVRIQAGFEAINEEYPLAFDSIAGFLGGVGLSYQLKNKTTANLSLGISRLSMTLDAAEDVTITAINLNLGYFF